MRQLQQDVSYEKDKEWNAMEPRKGGKEREREIERRILSYCSDDSEEKPKLN